MKILPVELIREADKYTIEHEPVSSIDLMERAAKQCFHWLDYNIINKNKISVFCGLGNNGGDGLAIARMLAEIGLETNVYIINHSQNHSKDFEINLNRLTLTQVKKNYINSIQDFPEISEDEIIIDAILGSGLNNPCLGLIADVIKQINKLNNRKIAIDIPSGLYADKSNNPQDIIFEADTTLTFELPKMAFFFPQNNKYVGNWIILPICLSAEFIKKTPTNNYLITKDIIHKLYKPRNKYAHKGNFGHALIISGSFGKMGAAVMAAKACLKAGVGLLTVHCPKIGLDILQTTIPEAMVEADVAEKNITCIHNIEKYDAIGIGPGIGTEKITQDALYELLLSIRNPLVIDADAINILSENKSWIQKIPEKSILTPHVKEFERLTQPTDNEFERNNLQREFSIRHKLYIILKGANTAITTPEGECYFNNTGNPGMATAGCGDVLTGIITSLLSQKYSSFEASVLGVYLHGLAGDIYKEKYAEESLIASDIIKYFGKVLKTIKL